MSWFSEVFGKLWGRRKAKVEDVSLSPFSWPFGADGRPQRTLLKWKDYISEGYNTNSLIYRCVQVKAETAAVVPLRAYTGSRDEPEALPSDHPVSLLLQRPNPWQSWVEFQELAIVYLNVAGNCYIMLSPEDWKKRGWPEMMWLLRPDRVHVVPKDGTLLGFVYVPEGRSVVDIEPILPENMIHVRYPNPGDRFEGLGPGLSPLSAAARTADVDNYVTDFINAFFKNAAVPYGILKAKTKLNEAEVHRIKERWKEQYGGRTKWHRIGVLDTDMDYQRIALTFEEFGFGILDDRDERRICMAFGVPPIVVGAKPGLDKATYSNYAQAYRSFVEMKMSAEYRRFADGFNLAMGSEDLWFEYDFSGVPFMQDALAAVWERVNESVQRGWVTRNEARAQVGLDPVPNGDVFLVPMSLVEVPVGGVDEVEVEEEEVDEEVEGEPEEEGDEVSDEGEGSSGEDSEGSGKGLSRLDDIRADRVGQQLDETARAWEPRLAEAARQRFEAERREVLALLGEVGKGARERKQSVDWQEYLLSVVAFLQVAGEEWQRAFLPLFSGLVEAQSVTLAADFGIAFDVMNPYVESFLNEYTIRFAEQVEATSEEQIRAIVMRGQSEGWSVAEMQNAISGLYQEWLAGDISDELREFIGTRMTPIRTEMIARTESIRSSNAGAWALYRAAGVTAKQWWTALDDRVCEFCAPLHGTIVEIETDYYTLGDEIVGKDGGRMVVDYNDIGYPPLHVLCRCLILPVVL